MIVEDDTATDAGLGLRPGVPSVQVDALIFQGSLEALDENVIDAALFPATREL